MCLLGRSAMRILDFLIGVQIFIEGVGDLLTLPDSFSENLHENEIILVQSEPP